MNLESSQPSPVHRAVLLNEVVAWLNPREGFVLVDGTVGAGGHASALAEKVGRSGRILGLDRDPAMLVLAEQTTQGLPVTLVQASYDEVGEVFREQGIEQVDGMLLDLGLSSDQLAWTDRGFSFAQDGPLDMRFDPEAPLTAADIVNTWPERELADLFYQYGEERHSRRVARRIVEERRREPIRTTGRLSAIVRRGIPGKWGPIDPATRVFQALRIQVNDELGHLERALEQMPEWLKPGARAVVISFQSLEDRRVKQAFRGDPRWKVLTKKVVTATPEEVRANPRSRSAKLRAAERIEITNRRESSP